MPIPNGSVILHNVLLKDNVRSKTNAGNALKWFEFRPIRIAFEVNQGHQGPNVSNWKTPYGFISRSCCDGRSPMTRSSCMQSSQPE